MPIAPSSDHDPVIWNLVFAGRASDVRDVWVDGRHVLKEGMSTLVSELDMLDLAHAQTIDLLKRREKTQEVKMIT